MSAPLPRAARRLVHAAPLLLVAFLNAAQAQSQTQETAAPAEAPTTQPRPSAPPIDDPCALSLPEPGFAPQERRAWTALCRTGEIDLSTEDDIGCDALGETAWGENRSLSLRFVETVLFREPYRSALQTASLRFRCVRFPQRLALDFREIGPALLFDSVRFDEGLSLFHARADNLIALRGARLRGGVDADGFRSRDGLFARDRTRINGAAVFTAARLGGALDLSTAEFEGGLRLDAAAIDGPMLLSGARIAEPGLTMTGLAAAAVDLGGAAIEAALRADGLRLAGDLRLDRAARIQGGMSAGEAEIGGDLTAAGASIGGRMTLDRIRIAGDLTLARASIGDATQMRRGWIGGDLTLAGGVFEKPLSLDETVIDGAMTLSDPISGDALFGRAGGLSLRRVQAGRLDATLTVWRQPGNGWLPVALDGLAIDRFGSGAGSMAEAPPEALAEWASAIAESPRTFDALATTLDRQGATGAARAVDHARLDHIRRSPDTPPAKAAGLALLDGIAGYGDKPWRAMFWLAGLVAAAFALTRVIPETRTLSATDRAWFSIDNTLPYFMLSPEGRRLRRRLGTAGPLFGALRLAGWLVVLATLWAMISL